MNKIGFRTISLMVSIILWGVMVGGGTYAAMVYFPPYLSDLPRSAVVVTGPYGLHEGVFWLAIHPLLILSLIVAGAANWKLAGRRKLMGIGIALYIAALIATQLYFLPELGQFAHSANSAISPAEWLVRARRWQQLNIVRAVVLFAGFVFLLLALARPEPARNGAKSGPAEDR